MPLDGKDHSTSYRYKVAKPLGNDRRCPGFNILLHQVSDLIETGLKVWPNAQGSRQSGVTWKVNSVVSLAE